MESVTELDQRAYALYQQGDYAEALPLMFRVLEINEKVLGLDHREIAENLDGLAIMFDRLGQYGKALPLYQRALAIREKVLRPGAC